MRTPTHSSRAHPHRRSRLPLVLVVAAAAVAALTLSVTLIVLDSGSSPAQDDPAPIEYVALGDSYTAAPYVPPTDPDDPCLRSDANYPHLLAEAVGRIDLTDVSCGAATTGDMAGSQELEDSIRPPQLDALTKGTDLVTLSIGANNYSLFSALIYNCFPEVTQGEACHTTSAAPAKLQELADRIQSDIEGVIGDVRERSPRARIIVLPYPQLIAADSRCPDRWPFGAADTAYIADANTRVSQALAGAAAETEVEWIDVLGASAGHDICSDEPWVREASTDESVAASFHPLSDEQQALAEMIEELVCAEANC